MPPLCCVFQLCSFNIPMAMYLGRVLDVSLSRHKHHPAAARPKPLSRVCLWLREHSIFVLLVSLQSYFAVFGFYKAYGLLAFVICPVRTWSIPFVIYLRKVALKPNMSSSEQNGTTATERELDSNHEEAQSLRAHKI